LEGTAVSAAEALQAARAAGIRLGIEGETLTLEAAVEPSPAVLDLLRRHKTGLVALLRPANDGWSAADWLALFEERAGVAEFDGGLSRAAAEARAFACCLAEWLDRHPVRSPPGRCLACGAAEQGYDPLLPFGTETTGHAWLHSRCWPAWHSDLTAQAIAALALLGITEPRTAT
jgi:hypothetical protein